MKRKLTAVLLALLMVLSLLPAVYTPKTAVADAQPIDQAIVQGGNILHCFDWSYDEIRANLDDIKAAGYVAVQTSPVQPVKDYNGSWTDTGGNWWKLYQPIGIRIAGENESWLGTAEDLTELCTAAEQKGIYVIVDIVANHLGNKGDGGYTVNGQVNLSDQVDEDLKNADYFHPEEAEIDYNNPGDRFNTTHRHMNMPDLNTGHPVIQEKVLNLLKACIDCGVDGFRFDAAKHIEVPADPEGTGSEFWPTVINGARTYASSKGANLFIYGEALDALGTAEVNYTQYIGLTDNVTGNNTRTAVKDQNAGDVNATSNYYRSGNPSSYVIWAESHDNYLNDHTDGIPTEKMIQTWAIVGARANSTALFFARPNERIGLASTDTSWKSPAVAAVNKFKNHYNGKGEYFSYDSASNKIVWIERGESGSAGVVIDKLDGAGSVNLSVNWMNDGTYEDEITGNIFTVSNGTIHGNVGPTGVAVVYKTSSVTPPTPSEYITANPIYFVPTGWWLNDGARFEMWVFNSDGGTFVTLTDADGDGAYEGALPTGNWTGVIFVRMNPNGAEHSWDSKWNQTENLVPDPGTDCFTITAGTSAGVWSVYGSGTVSEDAGYYIVGTMTGWSISPEFKMTRTGASTEEYTIDVPLMRTSKPYNSKFKVVYSPDGVTKDRWFPAGENNDYGYNKDEIPQSGVYTVYFRPNYDGGSDWHDGCIYAERTKFFVTVNDTDKNGTVTVDKDVAAAGETVTVTVTPNEGYELDTLVYMCETGFNTGEFDITEIDGNTFEMPAENAAVKATFREATVAAPSFAKQSLTLDGAIGLNFYMNLDGLTDDEKQASYMTFTISGAGSVTADPVAFDANNTNNDGTLYGFSVFVKSIQMADVVTATFHYGDGQTIEKTYSVKEYIEAFDAKLKENPEAFDEKTVALVHALADYGHYVQVFLTEANGLNGYADMEKFYAGDYDYYEIVDDLESQHKEIVKDYHDANINDVKFTVVLDSETTVAVYCTPALGYTGGATASWGDEEYALKKEGGRFVVKIPNIAAHQLGETYNINVFTGDNCYQQVTSVYTQVRVSAMSYVYAMLTSEAYENNIDAKNAVASLYAYWQAAQAYLDD